MQTDPVDAAINEVAAAMTTGEPGHAFASEVMNRLQDRGAPAKLWRVPFAVASVAVAVMAIVFVARAGRRVDHVGPVRPPTSIAAVSGASGSESPSASISAKTETFSTIPSSRVRRTALAHKTTPVTERPASPIEMLTVPLIATPKLTTDPIPVDPIAADRLDSIPLLAIAPLSADDDQRREK